MISKVAKANYRGNPFAADLSILLDSLRALISSPFVRRCTDGRFEWVFPAVSISAIAASIIKSLANRFELKRHKGAEHLASSEIIQPQE